LYGIIFYRGFDEVNPSIPSKTIEWLLSVQQLQLAFIQSGAILWLHDLQVHILSLNCVGLALSSKFIIIYS
jgi:hypothetical protein